MEVVGKNPEGTGFTARLDCVVLGAEKHIVPAAHVP